MSLKRNRLWLFAGALALLLGGPVLGQGLQDVDIFNPADLDEFGGGPRAHQGFFFKYEGLYWTLSAPRVATFGQGVGAQAGVPVFWGGTTAILPNESSTTQQTTLDTGFLKTDWTGGHRIEFGNIYQHEGWRIDYFNLTRSTQTHNEASVQAFFPDQPWGAPPQFTHFDGFTANLPAGTPDPASIRELGVEFTNVTLTNRIKVWGLDASYLRRTHPMPYGGFFEWSLGARYLEVLEDFSVNATGGMLADTLLWTEADNRLIGPHVGLRWFRSNDRWTFSASGDFTGAANMQTVRQMGVVGSLLPNAPIPRPVSSPPAPLAAQPLDFNHSANLQEFSPIIEFRLEAGYQLTQAIAVHGGWTGMWVGNLARPSNMIDYTLGETQTFGILTNNNRQNFFMNGLNLGVDINY